VICKRVQGNASGQLKPVPANILNLADYKVLKEILEWKGDEDLDAGQIGMAGVRMVKLARVTPKPAPNVASTQAPEPPKNYGVDISTLTRMIENGEL